MNTRPHILLSNDDGFRAPGLQQLSTALCAFADITIVGPDGPRSGFSSAITSTAPLRLKPRYESKGLRVYSCEGTPVDCVKLGLHALFADKAPDLVIAGINHGSNDGICVHYSGTIGAAREACIQGIKALATSIDDTALRPNFSSAIDYTVRMVKQMLQMELPRGTFLSLNIPKGEVKGLKVCPQALGRFVDEYMSSENARGARVYWLQGYQVPNEAECSSDLHLMRAGYATLTPLMLDQTDYNFLDTLSTKFD